MARKKVDWKPATEFRVTQLPANGPKTGQTQESWLRGKEQGDKRWDKIRSTHIDRLL